MPSTTDTTRKWLRWLFAFVVVMGTLGWFLGKADPAGLLPLLMTCAAGLGIGEAAMVAKRATFNEKAVPRGNQG